MEKILLAQFFCDYFFSKFDAVQNLFVNAKVNAVNIL